MMLIGLKKVNYTLYLNHLLVVYAFLIPISSRAKAAVLFLILVLFLLRGDYKYYLKESFSNKVVQAFFWFFILHILWLIGTDNFNSAKSIIDDMKYLLFPLLFLSFVDKRFGLRIITAFTLGMFYSEIVSYLIHFEIIPHKYSFYSYELYEAYAKTDPTPFLDHSRYTVLLSISISLLLYNILDFKFNLFFKSFVIFFIFTASVNLILIGGRIGYISFFVLILYVLFLKYKFNLKVFFIAVLIIFSFFVFAYKISDTFERRVNTSFSTLNSLSTDSTNYNSSFGLRLGFWSYSMKVIKDNLLFGLGTGDYLDEVKKNLEKKHSYMKRLSHAHNEYIKNLLQFGLIGLLFFLNIFYQIFRFKSDEPYKKNILLIVTVGIMVGIMTSIFGSKVYLPLLSLIVVSTLSQNNFLSSEYKKINLKQFLIYIVLIITALLISVLQ